MCERQKPREWTSHPPRRPTKASQQHAPGLPLDLSQKKRESATREASLPSIWERESAGKSWPPCRESRALLRLLAVHPSSPSWGRPSARGGRPRRGCRWSENEWEKNRTSRSWMMLTLHGANAPCKEARMSQGKARAIPFGRYQDLVWKMLILLLRNVQPLTLDWDCVFCGPPLEETGMVRHQNVRYLRFDENASSIRENPILEVWGKTRNHGLGTNGTMSNAVVRRIIPARPILLV